jgi:iron complex outermembrane receptor protein
MNTLNTLLKFLLLSAFACIITGFPRQCPASERQDIDKKIEDELQYLREEAEATFVITASRVKEDIRKSASSITVITAEQIRQMGARHLTDVLRTVPGMSHCYTGKGAYRIDVRGIQKNGSQNILIMVNSHPLNNNFTGGAAFEHDLLIVDNIKRIEVIRGPGSAMYGANAFSGVVNVITKEAEDIDGYQLTARAGTHNTRQYNLLTGQTWKDLGIAFNFNYFDTDGFEPYIEADTQTATDQLAGSLLKTEVETSYAPGYARGDDEKYDASLTLQYKGLKFDGKYMKREISPPLTELTSINRDGFREVEDYYLNLSYEQNIGGQWVLFGKAYRNYNYLDSYNKLYPNSFMGTPEGPDFLSEEGLIAEFALKNIRTGGEIQATYKMSGSNTIVAGGTYEKMKQYDVTYSANFLYTPYPNVLIPLDAPEDLTKKQNFNQNASRKFFAVFLQDIWDITDSFRLTLGARYDRYSDFGGSFNPRMGMTWEFIKGYNLKLIYGKAFRAPAFQELYNQNNPAVRGNPDLEPETVDTYEASLEADIGGFSGRITPFYNKIKDSIGTVDDPETSAFFFQNSDEIRSQGVEVDLKYKFGGGTYIGMNYTYQDAENLDTEEHFYNIPKHKGNIMANFRLSRYLNFYTDFYFQKDFEREEEDSRDDNSGSEVLNATLIANDFFKGLELRGSVYNLLDREYTVPYAKDTLPEDLPMPGRSYIFEVRYTF